MPLSNCRPKNIKSEAKIRNDIWSFLLFSAEFKLEGVGD